ncbi:MAG: hypothetical protein INR65_16105, partial [Gluconacetobacter diazotrophicus]|nr:hypothetical protein [Gluconacetobacter diazotrophicus]
HGFAEAAARELVAEGFAEPCRIAENGVVRLVTRRTGGGWRGTGWGSARSSRA